MLEMAFYCIKLKKDRVAYLRTFLNLEPIPPPPPPPPHLLGWIDALGDRFCSPCLHKIIADSINSSRCRLFFRLFLLDNSLYLDDLKRFSRKIPRFFISKLYNTSFRPPYFQCVFLLNVRPLTRNEVTVKHSHLSRTFLHYQLLF